VKRVGKKRVQPEYPSKHPHLIILGGNNKRSTKFGWGELDWLHFLDPFGDQGLVGLVGLVGQRYPHMVSGSPALPK